MSPRQSKNKTAIGKSTKSIAIKWWRICHHFMERKKEKERDSLSTFSSLLLFFPLPSSIRSVIKCVYGAVPRAVASVTQREARSLPLAVLLRRAFPDAQSQTALNQAK